MKTITTTREAAEYLRNSLRSGMRAPVSKHFAHVADWFSQSLTDGRLIVARAIPVEHWELMIQDMATHKGIFSSVTHKMTTTQVRFIACLLAYFADRGSRSEMSYEQMILAMINCLDWADQITLVPTKSGATFTSSAAFEERTEIRFRVDVPAKAVAHLLPDLGKGDPEVDWGSFRAVLMGS